MSVSDPVGVRVQRMPLKAQTLVLASLAAGRSADGTFSGSAVVELFFKASLPQPAKIANVIASLRASDWVTPAQGYGAYVLTPLGHQEVARLVGSDAPSLVAESAAEGADLGHFRHPLLPSSLAPPQLVQPVADFVSGAPASLNVFGMTRFPDDDDEPEGPDPVAAALEVTRSALTPHGLNFLLASQRHLVDDLWGNVSAHMWASSYGVGFFEDRRGRGLNYNLVIEIGAMLMAGRRCLLLKDVSIEKMPTDLVGFIYTDVDLDDPSSVAAAVHNWASEDLALGSCRECGTAHAA